MTRNLVQKAVGGSRNSLIWALLLLILFSGVQAIGTTAAPVPSNTVITPDSEDYYCCYPIPPSAAARQGMTSDGRPLTGGDTRWILPLIIKTDNTVRRLAPEAGFRLDTRIGTVDTWDRESLLTSTNMIASQLGRQFTLVGAKPSGTS